MNNRGRKKVDSRDKKSQHLNIRFTIDEWIAIDRHCERLDYKNKSEYIRDLVKRDIFLWSGKK